MTLRLTNNAILTIDGSRYSGSGTIVRQAVAFSALTAPTCPIADALLWQVDKTVRPVRGVTDVTVNLRVGSALSPKYDV